MKALEPSCETASSAAVRARYRFVLIKTFKSSLRSARTLVIRTEGPTLRPQNPFVSLRLLGIFQFTELLGPVFCSPRGDPLSKTPGEDFTQVPSNSSTGANAGSATGALFTLRWNKFDRANRTEQRVRNETHTQREREHWITAVGKINSSTKSAWTGEADSAVSLRPVATPFVFVSTAIRLNTMRTVAICLPTHTRAGEIGKHAHAQPKMRLYVVADGNTRIQIQGTVAIYRAADGLQRG